MKPQPTPFEQIDTPIQAALEKLEQTKTYLQENPENIPVINDDPKNEWENHQIVQDTTKAQSDFRNIPGVVLQNSEDKTASKVTYTQNPDIIILDDVASVLQYMQNQINNVFNNIGDLINNRKDIPTIIQEIQNSIHEYQESYSPELLSNININYINEWHESRFNNLKEYIINQINNNQKIKTSKNLEFNDINNLIYLFNNIPEIREYFAKINNIIAAFNFYKATYD